MPYRTSAFSTALARHIDTSYNSTGTRTWWFVGDGDITHIEGLAKKIFWVYSKSKWDSRPPGFASSAVALGFECSAPGSAFDFFPFLR